MTCRAANPRDCAAPELKAEIARLRDQNSSLLATNYDLRKERDRMTDELAEARDLLRLARVYVRLRLMDDVTGNPDSETMNRVNGLRALLASIDGALTPDQPSVSLRCQSEASVILRSIRGDIEAAYNGLDYLTSIHVATAADPNGGRQLAIDAAEIKGRLLQHMKRIDAAGDQLVAGQPERCCLDYPRCDCNSPPEPDNALACGHPSSLLLRSAETGEALYCELCDDKSGRRDAVQCETELRAEVERLKTALKTVGDDYPGSSCQEWCYAQIGLPSPSSTVQPDAKP